MSEDAERQSEVFAHIARELLDEPDVHRTLERAVHLAVETIDGCDCAGVSLVRGRAIESTVHTGQLVARADELQMETGEGPCLHAIRADHTVQVDDLSQDERWPRWGPRVSAELNLCSMLCFRLYNRRDTLGALNLYAQKPEAFDAADRAVGTVFAAHAAVALSSAQTQEQLAQAVETRTMIGQAEGIMMERFGLSADRAFELLRRVSQQRNIKLREVALEVILTRETPGP